MTNSLSGTSTPRQAHQHEKFATAACRWRHPEISREELPNETIAGLELVDLDEDGDLDVYLSNAGQLLAGHGFLGGPDRYFRNNGRGRFEERTTSHFVPPNDPTTDAAFGDIDGDGDLDLVVGNSGADGGERVFVHYPCAHGRCDIRSE